MFCTLRKTLLSEMWFNFCVLPVAVIVRESSFANHSDCEEALDIFYGALYLSLYIMTTDNDDT